MNRRTILLAGRRFVLTDLDAATALELCEIDANAALVLADARKFEPPPMPDRADSLDERGTVLSIRRC